MPKFFFDTEFHEGFYKPLIGRKRHFVSLISIGIIAEDDQTYSAVSKDFDLRAAWMAWQNGEAYMTDGGMTKRYKRKYWLRENVLKKVYEELYAIAIRDNSLPYEMREERFTYHNLKYLIDLYGKTNKQIGEEIVRFTKGAGVGDGDSEAEFYAYYADYDWVVFCSLFGTMMDLPRGFPKYCRDLKQTLDDFVDTRFRKTFHKIISSGTSRPSLQSTLNDLKRLPHYPRQKVSEEHIALKDAEWNKKLHNFLTTNDATGEKHS